MTTEWTATGTLESLRPYMRMTQRSKWTKPAKRYLASKGAAGAAVLASLTHDSMWRERAVMVELGGSGYNHVIDVPVRVGLVMYCPPTKKGYLPMNRGDYDNFWKALLDAMVAAKVIRNDSLRWFRGPCRVNGVRSGVYMGTEMVFHWGIEPALEE